MQSSPSGSPAYLPSLGRTLLAGLVSGMAGAALANVVAMALQAVTGLSFPELNVVSITLAALVANLIGSGVYYAFTRSTPRPATLFAILAVVLATLDSLLVTLVPPHPGFGTIANPLHYVVAFTAIVLMPLLTGTRH